MTASSHYSGRSPLMSPFCSGWRRHATDGRSTRRQQAPHKGRRDRWHCTIFSAAALSSPTGIWNRP
ncbi:putative tryptophanyl-tRNA synthetase [Trypanosoma cruzi]|nr:putative tryptophanyl-tRNA synthetase [Trypanosoma cruzi]PWU93896.1 putative tryptophanyl-tRNA synthetase [Trypanosoma cruzi]